MYMLNPSLYTELQYYKKHNSYRITLRYEKATKEPVTCLTR